MKKRIFASLLAICMLATSVFAAGTVVFEDGFEADYVDGLYISKPALRAYGDNLFTIGDFSTTPIKSADGATTYASNLKAAYNNPGGYIYQKDGLMQFASSGFGRAGGSMYTRTASSGVVAGYPVVIGIPVANMKGDTVYELEMWLKNDPTLKDAEGNAVKVQIPVYTTVSETVYYTDTANKTVENAIAGVGLLNPNGNVQLSGVTSGDNTYTRFVGRYSINADMLAKYKDYAAVHGQNYLPITLNIEWTKTGTAAATYGEVGRIFIDDVSFREVLNATASQVDGQDGMPVYNDALIAGEAANIVFDAVNETGAAKNITLITAEYNADGSLKGILDQQVVTVAGDNDNRQHIVSADITMPSTIDGEIKVFAWDGTTLLTPYADAAGTEDTAYLTGSGRANKYMAGSRVWKTHPANNATDHNGYAYTAEIISSTGSEGAHALYIPSVTKRTITAEDGSTSEATGATRVYTSFDTEVGKTYKLTFDFRVATYELLAFTLAGSDADSTAPTSTMKMPIGTITAPAQLAGPVSGSSGTATLAAEKQLDNFLIRFRSAVDSMYTTPWKQATYEFTANGEKTWLIFGPDTNNGLNADDFTLNAAGTNVATGGGARHRGYGAFVDNIRVEEVVAAAE